MLKKKSRKQEISDFFGTILPKLPPKKEKTSLFVEVDSELLDHVKAVAKKKNKTQAEVVEIAFRLLLMGIEMNKPKKSTK